MAIYICALNINKTESKFAKFFLNCQIIPDYFIYRQTKGKQRDIMAVGTILLLCYHKCAGQYQYEHETDISNDDIS